IEFDDELPLTCQYLHFAMKLPRTSAVKLHQMVAPSIGRMSKSRLRSESDQRQALRVARRNIQYCFAAAIAYNLAIDLPVQRVLLVGGGDVLLEHQSGLVGARGLYAAKRRRCGFHQDRVDCEHCAEEPEEAEQNVPSSKFGRLVGSPHRYCPGPKK